ncbi:quercetin dioxygenase-like cupin family protein [Streptomyces sp. 1114.5]|uniref:cupin domain-containing protein n=1 Tax=Streptomyces sp. 1114.5 TaxID=1938830 RepID=UPI000EB4D517|nr:cupin domain-containing protein [Streptomyces sp. 1114.5]RKT18201.1 quercetin dioxygenase-like cupin family protein [Streptomyces sp. 1114.5]
MPVIHRSEARRTETPNAVMTTLGSPTQGTTTLAMWQVEMRPHAQGPLHAMDAEQIWTLLTGSATVALAGETLTLSAGDTLVLPADAARRIATTEGFTAVVASTSPSHAYNPDARTPEDACTLAPRDAQRLLPPWIG